MTIIARPKFQLRSLPVEIRWEVTRRHPYYQIYWKLARAFHCGMPPASPENSQLFQVAVAVLGQIGVRGNPPDPATDFESLGKDDLRAAWLSGAVQPICLRGIAQLLMAYLPKNSLCAVATLMYEASLADAADKPPRLVSALFQLGCLDCEGLDNNVDEPIVSINPAASARDVSKALNAELNRWKSERGLRRRRNRSEKFDSYLRVWDMREGWNGSSYDRSREVTLRDVAQRLRQPASTAAKHYRRAFELIVGYPYGPEVWGAFFGVLKLTRLVLQPVGEVSRKRPQRSPQRLEVPESTLLTKSLSERALGPTSFVTSYSDQAGHEILLDIQSLCKKGRTPEEIAHELDLPVECIPEITSFFKRIDPSPRQRERK